MSRQAKPNHLRAYIDESGQRRWTPRSSEHFVMAAVIIPNADTDKALSELQSLRVTLGRHAHQKLHFRKLKTHERRLIASQELAALGYTVVSSIVCKHLFALSSEHTEDEAYEFALQLLLERLSWFARDTGCVLRYDASFIQRYKIGKLAAFEKRLRQAETSIAWESLDPRGGRLAHQNELPLLNLADVAASAIHTSIDPKSPTYARDYVRALSPALYRYANSATPLTSYGLKLCPSSAAQDPAYSWLHQI